MHTSQPRRSRGLRMRRDQLLQWAVGIYPLNTERPSPWQPPSRRSHPARQPHLAFLDELSQALTHPVPSASRAGADSVIALPLRWGN